MAGRVVIVDKCSRNIVMHISSLAVVYMNICMCNHLYICNLCASVITIVYYVVVVLLYLHFFFT